MFTWDFDPVLSHGVHAIRVYGLLFAVTVVSGFLLFRWQLIRAGHPEELSGYFLAYGVVAVIGGARLVHCFVYDLPRTLADPWSVVRPWEGGLSSHGALAGLLLAAIIFARRHQLRFAELADWLAPGAALAVVLIRVANFLNSEIVGRPTGSSLGVRFLRWDGPAAPARHPVQLYEAALGLILLALILGLILRRRQRAAGLLAALFLTLYFGLRLFLEVFKEPEGLPASSVITFGQLLSLAPALAGAAWLIWLRRRQARGPAGPAGPAAAPR